MSFSYSESLATDLDYVRFRLDDFSEPDEPLLSDEIINTMLGRYDIGPTLLLLCRRIALYFSKEPDKIGLSGNRVFSFKEQYQGYLDLYKSLEAEFGSLEEILGSGPPQMVGGVDILDFPPEVYVEWLPFQGVRSWPLEPWHRPLEN